MPHRSERLSQVIQSIASEIIIFSSQEYTHPYGIISVTDAEVTKDLKYADIYVHAQKEDDLLAKFCSQFAPQIEKRIHQELGLRKTPTVRFRKKKEQKTSADILTLIDQEVTRYGLDTEGQ